MKDWLIIALAVLVIFLLWRGQTKQGSSGYSEVRSKKQEEQCPDGFKELGPVICVKD
jgi:hypothetical protein